MTARGVRCRLLARYEARSQATHLPVARKRSRCPRGHRAPRYVCDVPAALRALAVAMRRALDWSALQATQERSPTYLSRPRQRLHSAPRNRVSRFTAATPCSPLPSGKHARPERGRGGDVHVRQCSGRNRGPRCIAHGHDRDAGIACRGNASAGLRACSWRRRIVGAIQLAADDSMLIRLCPLTELH